MDLFKINLGASLTPQASQTAILEVEPLKVLPQLQVVVSEVVRISYKLRTHKESHTEKINQM